MNVQTKPNLGAAQRRLPFKWQLAFSSDRSLHSVIRDFHLPRPALGELVASNPSLPLLLKQ
jgi:hypothetical protein